MKIAAHAAALAIAFNRLLGIKPGFFGSTPRQRAPSAGQQRAVARLAVHRKAQIDRLGDHANKIKLTRQLRRQMNRIATKQCGDLHWNGMTTEQRHALEGL
jgi:hypothetical protein